MEKIPDSQRVDIEIPVRPTKPKEPQSPNIFKRIFEIGKTIFYSVKCSIEVFRNRYHPIDLEINEQIEARTQFEILKDMLFDIDQIIHNTQYKILYYDYLSAKEKYKLDWKKYELQRRKLKRQVKNLPYANIGSSVGDYRDNDNGNTQSLNENNTDYADNNQQLPPYEENKA